MMMLHGKRAIMYLMHGSINYTETMFFKLWADLSRSIEGELLPAVQPLKRQLQRVH